MHHGALAYLLGINALRASEAAAVCIHDYQHTLRGHRVLRLVGKGTKPATMPLTVPVLRVLEACRGDRTEGRLILRPQSGNPIDRRDCYRMVIRIGKVARIPRHISPPLTATRRPARVDDPYSADDTSRVGARPARRLTSWGQHHFAVVMERSPQDRRAPFADARRARS
ncbi:MAG TPA: hypothetical protein VNP20_15790 [Nocardioidaceae bacterium]|nr:hypothetical protein [Nocardioidaceae bacterium]